MLRHYRQSIFVITSQPVPVARADRKSEELRHMQIVDSWSKELPPFHVFRGQPSHMQLHRFCSRPGGRRILNDRLHLAWRCAKLKPTKTCYVAYADAAVALKNYMYASPAASHLTATNRYHAERRKVATLRDGSFMNSENTLACVHAAGKVSMKIETCLFILLRPFSIHFTHAYFQPLTLQPNAK